MTERGLRILRWYALLVGLAMLLPLVVVVLASLNSGGTVFVPPRAWGFDWFDTAVHNKALVRAFRFSVETAFVVALISLVLGTVAAVAVHRYEFPGRRAILTFVMSPLLIPHIVLAIGLLQVFAEFGVPSSPSGLIAGQVVVAIPFVVRLVLAGVAAIDDRLEWAALSLGASRARTYWKVILPQIRPALTSAGVLAFLVSFDESVISVFTSTPTHTALPATLLGYYEERSDPLIAAVSTIMILIVVVAVLILDRFFGLLKLLSGGNIRA